MFIIMHYVCIGTCGGVSEKAGDCRAASCPMHDKPLVECGCEDGRHEEVFDEAALEAELEAGEDEE